MKLRQKLAVVLASAMIVSAVPVVTMAASTNTLSHTITLKEGMEVGFSTNTVEVTTGVNITQYNKTTNHPKLQLKLSGNYDFDTTGYTFYVNISDAEFNKTAFAAQDGTIYVNEAGNLTNAEGEEIVQDGNTVKPGDTFTVSVTENVVADVRFVSKTQMEVNVRAKAGTETLTAEDTIQIPLLFEAKKGEPAIEVVAKNSIFTGGKLSLTNEQVSDKALSVKVGDAKTISVDGGEIAKITVEEVVLNALNSATDKDRQITVKLPNSSDLEFDNIKTVNVKGVYGLNHVDTTAQVISNDGKEMVIQLPQVQSTKNTTGGLEITGITVSPEGREGAKLGKVDVTIKGENIDTVKATVAEVKDFDVILEAEEQVELVAGKDAKEVTVTLKEAAANSIDERRTIYFSVEGADIEDAEITTSKGSIEKVYNNDKEPKLIGFELDLQGALTEGKANEVELKFEVASKVNQTGDVKVVAESRSFDKDVETVIGTSKAAVTVEAKGMTVKVGLQGQVGGEIVINETEAGMLERNKEIIIDVVDAKDNGITLKDAKVVAENLQVNDVEFKDGQIILTVKRTSDEAGKITISDIKVDVNRMTPEGNFDVEIGGEAISNHNKVVTNGNQDTMKDVIKVQDFIVVGTPNTEDNASNGLKKGTGIFTVGQKSYTVNGEKVEMDAAPYISKANRIMVPVRYVSDVFGVNGKDVMFSKENGGTITIFAGNRVLQVVNGSNIALVNGVKVPMDEKVTIIDGRTYVPVGEMARLLDVDVEWSNETKTATFTNR